MIKHTFNRIYLPGLFIILVLMTFSCSTPLKEITYLNGIKTDTTYSNGPLPEVYRIRPNDQLYIEVISDDPSNAAFLNLTAPGSTKSGGGSGSMELITFLVDEQGKIEYPYLGEIEVGDLTVFEIGAIIKKKVDMYLESASVSVKLVNRTITVLGEVQSPGQKLMVKNKLTIFEALGTAGDMTDYGNRQNIKLIRELPNGKQIVELNLTDPKVLFSPYYYILPHDIIYVEHNTKVYGAKNMPYAAPIGITASLLSLVLLVLNLIK